MLQEIQITPPAQLHLSFHGLGDKPFEKGAFSISNIMDKLDQLPQLIKDLGMQYPKPTSKKHAISVFSNVLIAPTHLERK